MSELGPPRLLHGELWLPTLVNEYFKIVIQFLRDIAPEFCCHDLARCRIEASDAEVDPVFGVEDPYFGPLGRRLSFEWLPLKKIRNWSSLSPEWVIESAVHLRSAIHSDGTRYSLDLPSSCRSLLRLRMSIQAGEGHYACGQRSDQQAR